MSLRYRNEDGSESIVSGLTPGGDIEAGAVATRSGTYYLSSVAPTSRCLRNFLTSWAMRNS